MKESDFQEKFNRVTQKFLKEGITQHEAKDLVASLLEKDWVKKLMVFNDQAILVIDVKAGQYLYVSPSIENLSGYKADEFNNISSLFKILPPNEFSIALKLIETGLAKLASLNYSVEDMGKLRFAYNNWYIRKDGKLVNILQNSMGLAFNEQGVTLLEMIIICDITFFNNSPQHFYKFSKVNDDGSEEVLLRGIVEEDAKMVSDRELEIFSAITKGHTSEEIAEQLNISTETVKTHRRNILEKTKSENSIDLLRYGYAQGWL